MKNAADPESRGEVSIPLLRYGPDDDVLSAKDEFTAPCFTLFHLFFWLTQPS